MKIFNIFKLIETGKMYKGDICSDANSKSFGIKKDILAETLRPWQRFLRILIFDKNRRNIISLRREVVVV